MHEFYGSRVRHEYDQVYAKRCEEWDAASPEERHAQGMKEPAPVALRKAMTRKVMEGESAEFMADLQAQNDCEFDARMQAWRDGKAAPTTPQQYHRCVSSLTLQARSVTHFLAQSIAICCRPCASCGRDNSETYGSDSHYLHRWADSR